jgi:hypothetical protein
LPFFTPSVQLGAAQLFAVQMPFMQSGPAEHPLPSAQGPHIPPQSTSVSIPFFKWSVHVGPASTATSFTVPHPAKSTQIEKATLVNTRTWTS